MLKLSVNYLHFDNPPSITPDVHSPFLSMSQNPRLNGVGILQLLSDSKVSGMCQT